MQQLVHKKAVKNSLVPLLVFLPALVCSFELLDYALIPRFLTLSAFSFLFLIYLSFQETTSFEFKITPIRVLFILWICVSLLSGIRSDIFGEYLFAVHRLGLYLVVFLLLAWLKRQGFDGNLFLKSSVILALILCGIASWQFVHFHAEVTVKGIRPVSGLMSHKNLFSEYLVILFPFCLISTLRSGKRWKFLSGFAVMASALFIIILLGRAAWLGLAVMGMMGLFLYAGALPNIRFKVAKKKVVFVMAMTILLLVSAVSLLNVVADGAVLKRLLSIVDIGSGTAAIRIRIWHLATEIATEHPWLGIGLGDMQVDLASHHLFKSRSTFIVNALNDYATVLSETGVIALLSYVGLLVVASFRLAEVVVKKRFADIEFAALLSLVGFAAISFFSFPLQRIEHSVIMLFALAISDSHFGGHRINGGKSLKWALASLLLMFSCSSLWIGLTRYQSEKEVKSALRSRAVGDWAAVITSINRTDQWLYPIEPSTTPVVWYRGIAYFQLNDLDLAFEDFKAAYKVNPHHVHVLNNLATCHVLKGNLLDGIDFYRKTIQHNQTFSEAYWNLLKVYVYLGRFEDALDLIDNSPSEIHERLYRRRSNIKRQQELRDKRKENEKRRSKI